MTERKAIYKTGSPFGAALCFVMGSISIFCAGGDKAILQFYNARYNTMLRSGFSLRLCHICNGGVIPGSPYTPWPLLHGEPNKLLRYIFRIDNCCICRAGKDKRRNFRIRRLSRPIFLLLLHCILRLCHYRALGPHIPYAWGCRFALAEGFPYTLALPFPLPDRLSSPPVWQVVPLLQAASW